MKAKLAALNAKMATAQSVASMEVHLERVHGVKDAVNHPDEDVRLPARLRILEALGNTEAKAICRLVNGQRAFLLTIMDRRYLATGDFGRSCDHSERHRVALWLIDRLSQPSLQATKLL